MFHLVLASFAMALTPVTLDLAWRLASWIGHGPTPAVGDRETKARLSASASGILSIH